MANPDPAAPRSGGPIRRAPQTGEVVPARPRRRPDPDELDENPSHEDIERFGDPTRRCPECRKDVYDDVAICYHCGHAFSDHQLGSGKGRRNTVVIVVVVVLLAAFVLGAFWRIF